MAWGLFGAEIKRKAMGTSRRTSGRKKPAGKKTVNTTYGTHSKAWGQKYHQTGTRKSLRLDKLQKATRPGKRISKRGNTYWESRRNRTDLPGLRI